MVEELSYLDGTPSIDIFRAISGYPSAFFLDSSGGGKRLGRYSFMGGDPFLVFKSKKNSVRLEWADGRVESFHSNPFNMLRRLFERYGTREEDGGLPMTSGGVGYFSYDLKDLIEKLPDIARDDLLMSDCCLGFYDVVIIRDDLKGRYYAASSGMPETDPSTKKNRALERLNAFRKRFSQKSDRAAANVNPASRPHIYSNFSKEAYMKAVVKAKEYIRRGDIYQVNLSQRFTAELTMKPIELYSRLRAASPAPFSSFLDFGEITVASSSPERFLLKRGGYIETRPIKGTRPRGSNPLEDSLQEQELLQSMKDRAEHIMIVDLERNDLGRVCDYGTVKLNESMALEKYANVFHLVSTVSGRLKKGAGAVDCLEAAFPGGSITGAPKIRSMEIIEELEPVKRSVYTGAIGYISFDGNMDTSIAIRTFMIKGRSAFFSVGGGIVADSDPEKEYEETLHKARGMLEALGAGKIEEPAISTRIIR